MNATRPFSMLIARASVFWLGLFTVAWISVLAVGLHEAEGVIATHVDLQLYIALMFPGAAGWLFGLVIQELQHTSFAARLPGVRPRLFAGFVLAGLIANGLVALLLWGSGPWNLGLPSTFAIGMGAYCAAGVLQDPLRNLVFVHAVVVLLAIGWSADLARLAAAHPGAAALAAAVPGAAGLWRLFARSTFRRKPFRPTSPLPGRHSFERSREHPRRRIAWTAAEGPSHTFGNDPGAWARAAFHETRGRLGWKGVVDTIAKTWGLLLIVLISAWIDRGAMSFPRALAYSLFDALFRSPHVEPFGGKGGPYLMVMVLTAGIGIGLVMFSPAALGTTLLYPLSRLQRARVDFRCGLVDAALLLGVFGVLPFVLGTLLGWWLGFAPHFDFVPFHVRALAVTLAALPLAYRGRQSLQEAARRKGENTIVLAVFLIVAFVIAVGIGVWLAPIFFPAPATELSALALLVAASQAYHRLRLTSYYRTADLA